MSILLSATHGDQNGSVPHGFQPVDCDVFIESLGLHARPGNDGLWETGLRVGPQHLNKYGGVHGGVLAALVEFSCGFGILHDRSVKQPPARLSTISLNIDYVAAGQLGEWLQFEHAMDKRQGRLRFCSCILRGDNGRIVLRATAVLSAVER